MKDCLNLWSCWIFGVVFLSHFHCQGQSDLGISPSKAEIKGTPRILHYTRHDFNGDPQIWTMCQSNEGIMYFGNNDGTLVFDGARWHKVPLPNNSSVRSLLYSSEGLIYAGGFNEFGTIEKDQYGDYQYKSLVNLLRAEELNLENIWAIHEVQGYIVFRSFTKLVAIANNKALTIPTTSFYYSTVIDDELYLADGEGIKKLNMISLEFKTIVGRERLNTGSIASILPGPSDTELLILTKQGASYIHNKLTGSTHFLRSLFAENSVNQVLNAIKSSAGNYYLGTLSTQIMVLNNLGETVHLDEVFMNLQDNTVLNLFESNEGNIWALLNNGIDCINISSPVSVMFENASIFDVLIQGGKIYVATNQGLFVSNHIIKSPNFSSMKFHKIPSLEGQAWTLQNFQDKIICSHDRGVFILSDNKIDHLEGVSGVWKVIPVEDKPNHYLVCTYYGINLMRYTPGAGFEVLHRLEGFNESSRDIIASDEAGVFWVCHGYKGVFRIKIDKDYERVLSVEHYRENGLPSPYSINVFKWDGKIVFTTNQGLYTFNADNSRFTPHDFLNGLFGTDLNVRKLLEYGSKTWFVHDDEVGFFEEGPYPSLEKGMFLELKGTFNRGMECIVPVNDSNVLIGTNTGLYAYDLSFETTSDAYKTQITEVSYQHDANRVKCVLLTGHSPEPLANKTSNIRFEFSAPKLKDQTQVQYSYLLSGVDNFWSAWDKTSSKEYTAFRPGKYTFRVKARNMLGEVAPETSYSFQVLPVWYQTTEAYVLYSTFLLVGLFSSRKLVKKKIRNEKEKTRSEEQKKQQVLELEIEQMRLEREKERIEKDKEQLEEDVIYKSKELANYTMLLVKKRELLTNLREELKEFKPLAKNEKSRNLLRQLIRKIGIHLNDEEHIHVFETNFERVHHEFFNELKAQYPDLTTKELRLCALVKMNLTNKEIAPILNISIRGVETARYRLRKRLSINQNMVEFLEKLSSQL